MPTRAGYRPDIDGLRAVAVLLVLAFHAAPALAPGGFIGVDIFFVISGYLIAGQVWAELADGRFSMLSFYARRCRRIVPALAIVLVATWTLGWYGLFADEFENLGKHVLAGAAFSSNLLLARETGYFDAAAETKPLLHLWSLGVEEQFYLVWPALALLAFKRRYSIAALLGVLGAASLGLYVFAWSADPALAFYLLPTRFWEILAGAALAHRERSHERVPGRAGVMAAPAAAVLALAAFAPDFGLLPTQFWPIVAVAATLQLVASGRASWVGRTLLASRPVVFVGLISYPLYLWHWPLLTLLRLSESGAPGPALTAAVLASAFALAALTWLLVERPLRTRVFPIGRSPLDAMRCLASGGAALALAAVLGAAAFAKDGFPGRFDAYFENAAEPESLWRKSQFQDAACLRTGSFADAPFCRRAEGLPLRVAVMGDSHANHFVPGLLQVLAADGIGVIHAGDGGCPPLLGIEILLPDGRPACTRGVRAYVDFVISSSEIRSVVLASRISVYVDPDKGYRRFRDAKAADAYASNLQAMVDGYSGMISALRAAGKEVVVLTEVPQLGFDPKECVARRPMRFSPAAIRAPCAQPLDAAQFALVRSFALALAARHPDLRIVEVAEAFCREGACAAMLDGQLLYRDRDHLSMAGSRHVARQLRDALR
jgi:peptidoglycan/LPS O-acetylase OafA/YrhL